MRLQDDDVIDMDRKFSVADLCQTDAAVDRFNKSLVSSKRINPPAVRYDAVSFSNDRLDLTGRLWFEGERLSAARTGGGGEERGERRGKMAKKIKEREAGLLAS
ncbi:hypothetical protein PAMA_016844 [Pampus argenteus]